ncbi:Hypothetical predicted protein [Mytilus galloprovincialis]|uniref:Uncharacterized protein n=1 Tax=Mytilus galloprovincialis TaxID=29158 RepID=A0A8B6CCP6_MYTGA|nr:Hypothetical predicted protein [Mytilus galloprovincialis]
MPVIIQRDHNRLEGKMEERFGHTVMKERHVTEAKLRKRKPEESLRDFGQAIEDLFRRAYPGILRLYRRTLLTRSLTKLERRTSLRISNQSSGIFEVEDDDSDEDGTTEAEGAQKENVDRIFSPNNYPRNNGIGSQGRFYNRDKMAWKITDV